MTRLIDADEVKAYILDKGFYCDTDADKEVSAEIVDTFPTVDAEPIRHGHWIRKLDTRFGPKLNDIIICSNCSIAFSTDNMIRKSYCPNCGARMDEEMEE